MKGAPDVRERFRVHSGSTLEFYRKSGAVDAGRKKREVIGGQDVEELAIVWPRLATSTVALLGT